MRKNKTYNNAQKNGQYIDGRTLEKHYCIEPRCNNEISYVNWKCGNGRCQSCAVKELYKQGILNTSGKNSHMFGKKHTEETRRKMNISHGGTGLFKNERLPKCIDCGKELGDYRSKRCRSCNTKEQHRKNMFNYNKKPNKPEKALNKLLQDVLPREYKFVGNNEIIIDTFNPDFININGQKKIIELYGDYWHNLPKQRKLHKIRIKTYKKYGYKTLIIWEHKLKNLEKLKDRILKFNKIKS